MSLILESLLNFTLTKYLGLVLLAYCVYFFFFKSYKWAIRRPYDFSTLKGTWAVVTGASKGIGEEFVVALAQRGLNVVLIARSKDKMEMISSRLEKQYKVKTRCISADFTKANECLDLSVLVNNAGGFVGLHPFNRYFETSVEHEDTIIKVNFEATMRMMRLVLPKMVEKKRGLVLNVSSVSCVIPTMYLTPYVAAKAAVNVATESFAREFARHGIIIKAMMGGKIKTETYVRSVDGTPEFDAVDPKVMANNCLDLMNSSDIINTPAPIAAIQRWAMSVISYLPFAEDLVASIVFEGYIRRADEMALRKKKT